jgi:drug/metabolite transporter (DMT)-like permease
LVVRSTNVLFAALAFGAQMAAGRALPEWNGAAMACFAGAGVLSTYLGRWFFYESVVLWGPAKASVFQVSNPLLPVAQRLCRAWPALAARQLGQFARGL